MQYIYNKIKNNRLLKNIIIVASGTAGAQLISIFFMPIITRLYDPEAFGALGTFNAIIAIIGPLMALAYASAIVLPDKKNETKYLIELSYIIVLIMTIVISIGTLLIWYYGYLFKKIEIDFFILLFTPIAALLYGWQNIVKNTATRYKNFSTISKSNFFSIFISQSLQILFGLIYPLSIFLIIIQTLNIGIKALILQTGNNFKSKNIKNIIIFKNFSIKKIKAVAKKYKDFPKYRAPQILFNSATLSLPLLLLSTHFGSMVVGYYTLSRTILGAPISFIGQAVQDVIYPYFNEKKNSKYDLLKIYIFSVIGLLLLGTTIFLPVILFGEILFEYAFGNQWAEAGLYASIMAVWLWFMLASRPSIAILPILGLQKWFLWFDIFGIIIKIISLTAGIYIYKKPNIAIFLFSLTGALSYIYLIIYIGLRIKNK